MINYLFQNLSFKQVILKNTFWLVLANSLARLFKFFLIPIAARVLGPAEYGIFNYTVSLLMLFFSFSDLGLSVVMLREYPKAHIDSKRLVSTVFAMKMVLWVGAIVASLVGIVFIKDPLVQGIYGILLVMVFLDRFNEFFTYVLQAKQRMEQESISFVVETGITTAVGIFLLLKTGSLYWFSVAYLVGSLASTLVLMTLIKFAIPNPLRFDRVYALDVLKVSLPFLMTSLSGMLLVTSDTLLIKWLKGAEAVGFYQVGFRIVGLASVISVILNRVYAPILYGMYQEHDRLIKVMRQGSSLMYMFGIAFLLGGWVIGDEIIVGLFGDQYKPGIVAFKVMLIGLVFNFLVSLPNVTMMVLDMHVKNMAISAASSLVNVVLNVVLIPFFGIVGAAAATGAATMIDLIATYLYCHRKLKARLVDWRSFVTCSFAAGLMGVGLWVSKQWDIYFLWRVLIGIGLFFTLLLLMRERNIGLLIKQLRHGNGGQSAESA